ncbi:hypothetical protein [Methylobacterium fujisawaense]
MRSVILGLLTALLAGPACADAFSGATPATAVPPATALDGSMGTSGNFARADHTHAARVQRTVLTTASDGTATWTFARPISVPSGALPVIAYMVEDQGTPVVVQVTSRTFTSAGGVDTHTAVTIKAQRSQVLPAALVSLSALLNFNVFGGSPAAVKVNLFAADPTQ